jgi:superfamily II DNA/RNA helicase
MEKNKKREHFKDFEKRNFANKHKVSTIDEMRLRNNKDSNEKNRNNKYVNQKEFKGKDKDKNKFKSKNSKEILLDFDGTNFTSKKIKLNDDNTEVNPNKFIDDNRLINELRAKMKWEDYSLHQKLLDNISKLKFSKPTEIQSKVLGYLDKTEDLVVQARTGEGKTLCFGIPIVDSILKLYESHPSIIKKKSPLALILAPTRELGIQIKNHLENILLDSNAVYEAKKKELDIYNKNEASRVKFEKRKIQKVLNDKLNENKNKKNHKNLKNKKISESNQDLDLKEINETENKDEDNIIDELDNKEITEESTDDHNSNNSKKGKLYKLSIDELKEKLKEVNFVSKKINDMKVGPKLYHKIKIANILGGFAKVKQIKMLTRYNPEIIIATPGRLWEILENDDAKLDFNNLRFLVIDEADRMMQKNHFKELKKIVNLIYQSKEKSSKKNDSDVVDLKEKIKEIGKITNVKDLDFIDKEKDKKIEEDEDNEENEDNEDDENEQFEDEADENEEIDENDMEEVEDEEEDEELKEEVEINDENDENMERLEIDDDFDEDKFVANLLQQKGIKNAKVENVDMADLIDHIKDDIIDETGFIKKNKKDKKEIVPNESSNEIFVPDELGNKGRLRTILCSATIDIKSKEKNPLSKAKQKKNYDNNVKKNIKKSDESREILLLEELIKNLKFYNKLAYVKLDPHIKLTDENIPDLKTSFILPEKLELQGFKCQADNKDFYLYHILNQYKDKTIIVFSNSISQTKKIFSLFSYFDFNIKSLHSQMQQRSRIKKLDKFRSSSIKKNQITKIGNVLICTDVGSRGLDIPEVDVVINYHIPLTCENFVHRSGRTARANKSGICISLVSEKELTLYQKILRELKIYEISLKTMGISHLDQYKMMFDQVRKFEKDDFMTKKSNRESEWIKNQADKCEIIPDDDLLDEINKGRSNKPMLNKKRKKFALNNIEKKKLNQKILSHNISTSSYIDYSNVSELNKLLESENKKLKNLNLTETLRNSYNDLSGMKNKKHRKTRHVKRH